MKKLVSGVLVITMLLGMFVLTSGIHQVRASTVGALEVAEGAAVYVLSQAQDGNPGYKWTVEQPGWTWERPYDVSEIGIFLTDAFQKTANTTYLDYANGAAEWLISKAVSENGGYKWASPDTDIPSPGWWLSPVVSQVGEFFLQMYRLTGNSTYLDYSEGAAQWMISMAQPESGGYFIPYNPPGMYGSQASHGIQPGREAHTVTFLLHLYQETGDPTYLFYVEGMADWLIQGPDIQAENGGYKWGFNRPYGTYYSVSRGFWGGSSLIASFFYEAYQAVGNETYLDYANGAIQWILSQAVVEGNMAKWPDVQGSSNYYITLNGPTDSPVTMADMLLNAFSVTGNSTYLQYATMNANWIMNQAVEDSGGYMWPTNEPVNAFTTASLYAALKHIHSVTGNSTCLQYAQGALAWVINNATIADGGYKWITLPYDPYYSWWSGGAPDIGYYMLSTLAATVPQMLVNPSASMVGLNTYFSVDLDVRNVTDLYNWEVKIYYDKALLNYTGATEGSYLKTGGSTIWADSSNPDFNETYGMVYIGSSLLGRILGVNGTGTLATISFQAFGNTTLTLSDALMLDSSLNDIAFETVCGYVLVGNENVAVSAVTPDKRVVCHNLPMNITVTVDNLGASSQTFNVTLCLNSTAIGVYQITDLAPNETLTFTYKWNASSFPVGNYLLNVSADQVAFETNQEDNTCVNGTMYVSITGDITGRTGVPDNKVDMRDIGLVARDFNTPKGNPYYVPECDLNDDGIINMWDIGMTARHFGDHYP